MKVLFVSPEITPIVRTGGLGDVVGSLPIALRAKGVEVRVICPLHRQCKTNGFKRMPGNYEIKIGKKSLSAKIWESSLPKGEIPVYLIENPELFDREGIYSDKNGDYEDNATRAFALSQSALASEKITKWKPDVFHAHDWMSAPTCAYLNAAKQKDENLKAGSILTIHNLEHQGSFSYDDFLLSNLPLEYWGMAGFEHNQKLNLLKGGIQHADKLTTVSPTYAHEIRTSTYGQGLENSLVYRAADLIGILNGIDENCWDPENDPLLPHTINPLDPESGKNQCKESLLKEMNLPIQLGNPLFGVVSRLYHQKGLDLLLRALPEFLEETKANFVILGSGDSQQEKAFKDFAGSYPNRVSVLIGFDDGLARRIFGGSDFFLMPSRFEPCGLAQQYAMRYGSIPIARKTGGLADTIRPAHSSESCPNGFIFEDIDFNSLIRVFHKAIELHANRKNFARMRKNAMNSSFSWDLAAEKYLQIYRWTMEKSSTF